MARQVSTRHRDDGGADPEAQHPNDAEAPRGRRKSLHADEGGRTGDAEGQNGRRSKSGHLRGDHRSGHDCKRERRRNHQPDPGEFNLQILHN